MVRTFPRGSGIYQRIWKETWIPASGVTPSLTRKLCAEYLLIVDR